MLYKAHRTHLTFKENCISQHLLTPIISHDYLHIWTWPQCTCFSCSLFLHSMWAHSRLWSRLSPHAPLASAGDSFLCKAEGRKPWPSLSFKKSCGVGSVFADVLILLRDWLFVFSIKLYTDNWMWYFTAW